MPSLLQHKLLRLLALLAASFAFYASAALADEPNFNHELDLYRQIREAQPEQINNIQNQIVLLRDHREELWVNQKTSTESSGNLSPQGQLFVNPVFDFHGVDSLKTGDLLLSRGSSSASHLIVSQGEALQSFAHVAMFFRDSQGLPFTVEEDSAGLVVNPWTGAGKFSWPQRDVMRALVARNSNSSWAKRAAEILVRLAQNYGPNSGNHSVYRDNVPFNMTQNDFYMDRYQNEAEIIADSKATDELGLPLVKMKCTEAIRLAYRLASREVFGQEILIPNQLSKTVWEKYLTGNEVFPLYLPIDSFASDPHFDVVAEWTSPKMSKRFQIDEGESRQLLQGVWKGEVSSKSKLLTRLASKGIRKLARLMRSFSASINQLADTPPENIELILRHNLELAARSKLSKSMFCRDVLSSKPQ